MAIKFKGSKEELGKGHGLPRKKSLTEKLKEQKKKGTTTGNIFKSIKKLSERRKIK